MYNEMDTQRIYSIDEVATMTGLTREHLARRDGQSPIDRVNETFYWRDDLGSRKDGGLTEHGLALLNTYLYECGADGIGTPYEKWQAQVWKDYGVDGGAQTTTALTVMPDLSGSLTDLDGSIEADLAGIGSLQNQFIATLADFDQLYYNAGRHLGKRGTSQMAKGVKEEIAAGFQRIFEEIKKVG